MEDSTLPAHARPRPKHWALVAAACAALVAAAVVASPASGTTAPAGAAPRALPTAAAPDPAKAQLPLDCGPFPVTVTLSFNALLDGIPSTVAAAHCAAPNGTPTDGVFLLAPGPTVRATLLHEADGLTVTALKLRSDGTVTGTARGYSSDDVPRFAPDLILTLEWRKDAAGWHLTKSPSNIRQ
ncbi:hypothetical protein CFP65_1322 [Kitasatospora sp. MMS16-BH015]|uniref:hypothetical protein n=1 Tax=Kitasatospora sp. MMS16-BH015 TaxID=2018025 RepID=UPI000CA3A26D|nr:hypothetical protein [Kitasatospora sp. MMS16-BH015]AUG76221.1 hypothetical protein CFP65_1322 [Kitasatospora sp. MMS16-BH015]